MCVCNASCVLKSCFERTTGSAEGVKLMRSLLHCTVLYPTAVLWCEHRTSMQDGASERVNMEKFQRRGFVCVHFINLVYIWSRLMVIMCISFEPLTKA